MKEHEHSYWNNVAKEDRHYKKGLQHGKSEAAYSPPKEDNLAESYRQGYHEGDKTRKGNR